MLTPEQRRAAAVLLAKRPSVIPGTFIIRDAAERAKWNSAITSELRRLEITEPEDRATFCDACGAMK